MNEKSKLYLENTAPKTPRQIAQDVRILAVLEVRVEAGCQYPYKKWNDFKCDSIDYSFFFV